MSLVAEWPAQAEPEMVVAAAEPPDAPTARSVWRLALAPARYAQRDWWPARLAQALPTVSATDLPESMVAPLSALLLQRHDLRAAPDDAWRAEGAWRPLLLAPPHFDCVVSLLGVVACRPALMQRVDAATYRAVLRAVPGVNLADFFAQLDADSSLQGRGVPLPLSGAPGVDESWADHLAKVGARLVWALAQDWRADLSQRLRLRLPRRAVGASGQTVPLNQVARAKLARQWLACLAALEDPQWL